MIKSLPERHRVLQGSVRADFEVKDELDAILADTEFTLIFTIGTRDFHFGGCRWKSSRIQTKIEETVAQNLEWEAKSLTIT